MFYALSLSNLLLFKTACVLQEEAPTLYLVTCSTNLQKSDISGVVADSLLHVSTVPSFKESTKKLDGSHGVNGTAGK